MNLVRVIELHIYPQVRAANTTEKNREDHYSNLMSGGCVTYYIEPKSRGNYQVRVTKKES